MKNNIHFLLYLAQFFLERDVSDKICGENQSTFSMFNEIFFSKILSYMR